MKNDIVIGSGSNGPPPGYTCIPEYCGGNRCREYAVHAEVNAIFDAMRHGHSAVDSRGYHIKTVDGNPVGSTEPSCIPCSKTMTAAGIKEFVLVESLYEPRFALYEMSEFHHLSMKHHWGDLVDKLRSL